MSSRTLPATLHTTPTNTGKPGLLVLAIVKTNAMAPAVAQRLSDGIMKCQARTTATFE